MDLVIHIFPPFMPLSLFSFPFSFIFSSFPLLFVENHYTINSKSFSLFLLSVPNIFPGFLGHGAPQRDITGPAVGIPPSRQPVPRPALISPATHDPHFLSRGRPYTGAPRWAALSASSGRAKKSRPASAFARTTPHVQQQQKRQGWKWHF